MEMQRSSLLSGSPLQTPMLTTYVLAAPEDFVLEMEIFSEMICRTTSRTNCSKIRLIFKYTNWIQPWKRIILHVY